MKKKIRIGCGAGFSGDRIDAAWVLAENGELDYLVLECLAERTIALAQKRKLEDATKGYDPLLERRIIALLPLLVSRKIRLITNMGAANPLAAARKIAEIAASNGFRVNVAAVTGDDLLEDRSGKKNFDLRKFTIFEGDQETIDNQHFPVTNDLVVSANAYLGMDGIVSSLEGGADIVVTGRVADPSLFLAPMVHEFGWDRDDFDILGKGTIVGHLLECAGQLSGGYFADPVKKPVANLERLGHPYADVFADGTAVVSKVEGTGGCINLMTVKEQLLYEVINPGEYVTPDVVADFSTVRLAQLGKDSVGISGGGGRRRPSTYKVCVGYKAFYLGEGEISYAGESAYERARMAGQILAARLSGKFEDVRVDYIGVQSAFTKIFADKGSPYEVRLRVAGRAKSMEDAQLIGEETEALYTNGPAGGGGVRKYATEVVGIISVLSEREIFTSKTTFIGQ